MSPAQEQLPLTVSIHGFTDLMKNTLMYFFKGQGIFHCEIVDDNQAEVRIIDLDNYIWKQLLEEHRVKYAEKQLIVLSVTDKEIEDAIFIAKPLKQELLISALEAINDKLQSQKQAESALLQLEPEPVAVLLTEPEPEPVQHAKDVKPANTSSPPVKKQSKVSSAKTDKTRTTTPANKTSTKKQAKTSTPLPQVPTLSAPLRAGTVKRDEKIFIGSVPDIDPANPAQLARVLYDPEKYFQHHIQHIIIKASKSQKVVLMTMPHGSLAVLPDKKTVLLDITESKLRAFCAVPFSEKTLMISFLEKVDLQKYRARATSLSLEQLVWNAAIWASRGRVSEGTSLLEPVIFQPIPNYTYQLLFPYARQITQLWTDQSCSMIETASRLQIPQRYVFTFYSASNSIGRAHININLSASQNKKGIGNGKLLRRILKPFSRR